MTTLVPPLRPNAAFTDSKGNLSKEGYDFLYNLFLRVGGSLDSLNAATLADKTWGAPNPIGSSTPSTGKFTTLQATTGTTAGVLTATTATITSGVSQGAGLKHARVTTGAITAGASALVTCTWASPFTDTNYTVVASVIDSTVASASLRVIHIESKTASAVVVRVDNTSGGTITGTINLIAMHD